MTPESMTKPELVAEALRLGLGRSKAALDVYSRGELLRKVTAAQTERCPTCGGPVDWTDPDTGTCIDPRCGDET